MPHSTMNFTLADEVAPRSGMYQLLARFWLREADGAFLRQLASPPLRAAFVEAGGVLPADGGDETIEQLAIDYCQLFIGPRDHLPPIQSVWRSGRFHGTPSESMKQFFDVVGYDAGKLPRGMMPDHLGVQLDVMGHILGRISDGSVSANSLNDVLDLASSFFAAHLRWPGDLFEAATRRAKTDFYRSAILLSCDFLTSEMQANLAVSDQQRGITPSRVKPD